MKKHLNLPPPSINYYLVSLTFIACLMFMLIGSCKREALAPKKVKISVNRPTTALQGANTKASKNNNTTFWASYCYFVIPSIEGYLSARPGTEDLTVLYEVADIIEANFNEVAEAHYATWEDAMSAFITAQQNAFNLANSRGLNYEPPGAQYDPAVELCPGDAGYVTPVNPCMQKMKINSIASDTTIAPKNIAVRSQTGATGNEYGYEQKITNVGGPHTYVNTSVRTDGATGSFTPGFTWNSTDGYTIGVAHGHPAGNAPSVDDVLWLLENIDQIPSNEQQYYKDNITVSVVTANSIYTITITDWDALQTIKNNKTLAALRQAWQDKASVYLDNNNSTDHVAASEYATLSLFGKAINLYRSAASSTDFKPLQLDGTYYTKITPCK